MIRPRIFFLFVLLLHPAVFAADYVFDGVAVLPMDTKRVLENQRVVVSEGLIAALGPVDSVPVPTGAERIDAGGAYLMPGLAEMHAHVPPESAGEQRARDILMLYLANGITRIRGMLGEAWHLELRSALEAGDWQGPRLYTSGPSFNGRSVSSPEQAAEMVRAQAAAGYDFLKLHPGLRAAEYRSIAATARAVGIPIAGHVSVDVGLGLTLDAAQATIDHLDGYAQELVPESHALHGVTPAFFGINLADGMSDTAIPALARATRKAGVWNVPTQSLLENMLYTQSIETLLARPEMAYIGESTRQNWIDAVRDSHNALSATQGERYLALRRDLILALQKSGAGLLLGSDAPQIMNVPGFSIHEELAYMVGAGLTPFEALRSGTANVDTFLGEKAGLVARGYRADLVLLDSNPFEEIDNTRSVRGVMLAGRWFSRETLDQALAGIRERKL